MPGLTSNTDGKPPPQTPVPVPVVPSLSQASRGPGAPINASSYGVAPTRPTPIPAPATSTTQPGRSLANLNTPSLGATPNRPIAISTPGASMAQPAAAPTPAKAQVSAAQPSRTTADSRPPASKPRSSPPQRPVVEPLTPPLKPQQFPPPRQSHAYSSYSTAQTVIAAPAPEPIEFDSNPDVLALKSAMSILQMQSAKARRDMVTLQNTKKAALEDPEAFLADLGAGKVGAGERWSADEADNDDESSSDEESNGDATMDGIQKHAKEGGAVGSAPDAIDLDDPVRGPKPWDNLPVAQNIVRMPPINWNQYAVAGESLDKLHSDQLSRPTQGVPATVKPDGMYEFRGAGKQEQVSGIAAPFNPLKDKLDKKPKGPNRQK
ncbi:hypothetical protein BJ170DRAFT_454342 [Xylariales sp. AK1849]|nr:hypothetical protein BJ170DRAFT_454342 [Xylariales sp. AK1849]